jgi:hypothetical protein
VLDEAPVLIFTGRVETAQATHGVRPPAQKRPAEAFRLVFWAETQKTSLRNDRGSYRPDATCDARNRASPEFTDGARQLLGDALCGDPGERATATWRRQRVLQTGRGSTAWVGTRGDQALLGKRAMALWMSWA